MSEEQKKIIGFRIKPAATGRSEGVQADECMTELVPMYVFRHRGVEVRRILASDLQEEPVPTYPQTPEQKQAWKDFQVRARKTTQRKNLRRE